MLLAAVSQHLLGLNGVHSEFLERPCNDVDEVLTLVWSMLVLTRHMIDVGRLRALEGDDVGRTQTLNRLSPKVDDGWQRCDFVGRSGDGGGDWRHL